MVVIRYEGPKGGPGMGMQEMLAPTSNIMGMGLGTSVALITDGRFSGAARGAHRPRLTRSRNRGPIGLLRDGDVIEIDIPGRSLCVDLPAEELARRRAERQAPQRELSHWLKRYAAMVTSGSEGAVLKV